MVCSNLFASLFVNRGEIDLLLLYYNIKNIIDCKDANITKHERHTYYCGLKITNFPNYMQFLHSCKYCIIVLNFIQLFLHINSEIFNAVYI